MSVFRKNSTAVITGGCSGIGLEVAILCLKHGMRVAIADNDSNNIAFAQSYLWSEPKYDVEFFQVDVTKEEDWKSLAEKVRERWGLGPEEGPDFLMLNAGVGARGSWGDGGYFRKILDTNLYGVINGLNTFVRAFQKRDSATPSAIVITGSKQGITNPPGNPAYNASKAAVKALAEHLSFDLRDSKTSVHLLVPGWTHTGLTGANTPLINECDKKPDGAWTPGQVAKYMYEKMQDEKFYIICPDNDVSETTDKKRMLWTAMDIVKGRPPLTRWRPEFKEDAEKWMEECDVD